MVDAGDVLGVVSAIDEAVESEAVRSDVKEGGKEGQGQGHGKEFHNFLPGTRLLLSYQVLDFFVQNSPIKVIL